MNKIENQKIQASEIRPGMILKIYGGTKRVDVERVQANEYGAVIIFDYFGTASGLSATETVEILGYFNL